MAFGAVRLQCDCLSARVDASLEQLTPFRLRRMTAQPIVGARQLPCSVECLRVVRQFVAPRGGRGTGAGEVRAIGIEYVRVLRISCAQASQIE